MDFSSELKNRLTDLLHLAVKQDRQHAVKTLKRAIANFEVERRLVVATGSKQLTIICSASDEDFIRSSLKPLLASGSQLNRDSAKH